MDDVLLFRNTEGARVAEVDLDATEISEREVIDEARRRGATLLWAYSDRGPATDGFVAKGGYARLHAESPLTGDVLSFADPAEYGPLLARAYLGLWGHRWVDDAVALPIDGSVVLCLRDGGNPVALCRVWPEARMVDQPGVVPEHRGVAPVLSLLGAAGALLGPGPVDVETWGESPEVLEATADLGFVVAERRPGWELPL